MKEERWLNQTSMVFGRKWKDGWSKLQWHLNESGKIVGPNSIGLWTKAEICQKDTSGGHRPQLLSLYNIICTRVHYIKCIISARRLPCARLLERRTRGIGSSQQKQKAHPQSLIGEKRVCFRYMDQTDWMSYSNLVGEAEMDGSLSQAVE